ncbi:unnamed protein product [Litomosoides sigmodontis]|uniref:Protein RFT1 homolog n=1 Tax=Litomosoides sigmodontis TaxID=42156 RepID=A0A3P6UVS1_LITSI|nr:unnamed protein product [Litomosoides sigmodontis]
MYLLRRIDSDALGLVNVNLMLFYSTTIFLVREPFRKVFLASEMPLSTVVTHLWLAPLICPLIAAVLYLCFWLPFSTVPDASLVPSYAAALFMFAFSAWLESFAEPYVILSLRFGMDAQYAFAQGFLVVMQRIFVLILIIMVPVLPVHAFCCAQVKILHYHILEFFLYRNHGMETPLVIFLTVFDAVDKLGSLVARIIFAPLEHSAYLHFSTCLRRGTSLKDRTESAVRKGINSMNGLLHIVTVIGSVIFVFAIPYSPLAVKIYGGALLVNNAGKFLMCIKVLSHGWYLFLSSPIQLFLSSLLSYVVGAYGLILANIISMLMRIAYSWRHIRRFSCGQISFLKVLPNFSTILILLFSLIVTSLSLLIFGADDGIMHNAAHVAVGCSLFIFVINHIYQNDLHIAMFLSEEQLDKSKRPRSEQL